MIILLIYLIIRLHIPPVLHYGASNLRYACRSRTECKGLGLHDTGCNTMSSKFEDPDAWGLIEHICQSQPRYQSSDGKKKVVVSGLFPNRFNFQIKRLLSSRIQFIIQHFDLSGCAYACHIL